MTLGSLFDGIGGWPLAAMKYGIEPVWASEIEAFPIAVTKHHFPNMKHLGDIRGVDGASIEPVDILCAGSPCQNLSVAGNREGLAGAESSLFHESIRIMREMRNATNGKYPRYFVWENVPGAFSSNRGLDFRAVLEEISESKIPMPCSGKWAASGLVRGEHCEIAWVTKDAQHFGVPQRRKRIFLVASFGKECAGEILLVEESLSGNPAEVGGEGEGTAPGTEGGAHDSGRYAVLRMRAGKPGGGKGALVSYDKSLTLAANTNDQALFCLNDQGGSVMSVTKNRTNALRAEEHGHQPVVYSFDSLGSNSMKSANPHSGCHVTNIAKTLDTTNPDPSKNQGGIAIYDISHRSDVIRQQSDGKVPCMAARYGTGGNNVPVIHVKSVYENQRSEVRESDVCPALLVGGGKPGQGYPCIHTFSDKASTLRAEAGAPKHLADIKGRLVYAIQGNMIGRDDKNGPAGSGVHEDVSFTLTAADRHAVCVPQDKDAPHLASGKSAVGCLMANCATKHWLGNQEAFSGDYHIIERKTVRKLTPLECERLQGLPDGYTDIPINGKPPSDSARYKALGNGMAQPCPDFVIRRIAEVTQRNRIGANVSMRKDE